jgi:ribosomal RNA-processing protein 1
VRGSALTDLVPHIEVELRADDPRTPASLTFHLAEIYLPELDKTLSNITSESHPVPILILLDPFLHILGRTTSKHKYKHVQDAVFQPMFDSLSSTPTSGSEEEDDNPRPPKRSRLDSGGSLMHLRLYSTVNIHMASPAEPEKLRQVLSKRVFEVASSEDTRDVNRKRLYAFLKTARVESFDGCDE